MGGAAVSPIHPSIHPSIHQSRRRGRLQHRDLVLGMSVDCDEGSDSDRQRRWDAKDWLWDADRESKAPMIRWKSSLCTVSPASEVYNRTAYRRFANDHAAGRPPSRETSTVPRSQGKRPMTAAVNSRPPSTGGGRSRSRNRPHTAVRCLHFCTC
jgi:hypothetical protein